VPRPGGHVVKPFAEAAERQDHFNYVREIPLDCFRV
jgi:hypothetical protein